jgi:hypothetical protein
MIGGNIAKPRPCALDVLVALVVGASALGFTGCSESTDTLTGGAAGAPGDVQGQVDSGGPTKASTPATPGVTKLRRLTSTEYANTVRDLLGVTKVSTSTLANDTGTEFDNSGDLFSISAPRVEEYLALAEQLAGQVDTQKLSACDAMAKGEAACVDAFVRAFGARALRRAPEDAEVASYAALFTTTRVDNDYETSLQTVLIRMLVSPSFLYHVELGEAPPPDGTPPKVTPYELASRLSYLFWETAPDDALLSAAAAGSLVTPDDVAAQVSRLQADARAHDTMRHFHEQWLKVDALAGQTKDATLFPGFASAQADLVVALDRFLDDVVWQGGGDVRALFTASYAYANANVASLYGWSASGPDFVRIELDPARSAGVLTQPALMATLSHADKSAPILRGVFVMDRVLCAPPEPPPPGAGAIPPNAPPADTTREFFANLTAPPACQGCHGVINPIGWGFENFDAVGAWRTAENGVPVDPSGHLGVGDSQGDFKGASELAKKLAVSGTARACMVKQWFRFGFGRTEVAGDAPVLDDVLRRFDAAGDKILALPQVLTQTETFYRLHYSTGAVQ